MDNPHPGKTITSLELEGMRKGSKWMIAGITLSDHPVFLMPGIVSTIPAHWGAAALVDAMYEGLAGAVNKTRAFKASVLSPRWAAAGVDDADVVASYAASGGYLAYRYRATGQGIHITVTSGGETIHPEILLPPGKNVSGVKVNGMPVETFRIKYVEKSPYLWLPALTAGVHDLEIQFSSL